LRQMLDKLREQADHLKLFGTELVAQVAKPLREELPEAIRASFHESLEQVMGPAMEKISQGTSQSMDSLAGKVGSQITDGVHDSVREMNEAMGSAVQSFNATAGRLDQTVGSIGGRIDEAVQSIHSISSEGAQKIGDASRAMAETAEALMQTVQSGMKASAEESAREIESAGKEMASGVGSVTSAIREGILEPMNELILQTRNLASQIEVATGHVGQYADSVEGSAATVKSANSELTKSAEVLANVAIPVRDTVQAMGNQVEEVSTVMLSSAKQTTEHMAATLRGARESIEASQIAVREGLDALKGAVAGFREVLGRYHEIDRSLGGAFEKIETTVASNIAEFSTFQRKLNEELGEALNRLQTILDQAEPFTPRRNE